MKILGLPIPFTGERKKALATVNAGHGGWFRILEPFAGAWQHNVSVDFNQVQANNVVFACQTLIASDISKLRVKLVERGADGIWSETMKSAFSPVLRKPNHYQTRIQFFEHWVLSKLQTGNTFALKRRDNRNVVTALYVLDPHRVRPMVADNGDVFYELSTDNLAGIAEQRILVPSREIIHDRFNCLFHPLVGVSPIYAAGLAAMQGISIQNNSTRFFQNGAQPGGILTAPGSIADETAARLKEYWETNFSGANRGKVAVVGDGLSYAAMTEKAVDSQLIEQLKWTAEVICSVYHVPPYKVGLGQMPTYNNVQALNVEYYSQALQVLIESIEICLDEGLGMGGETLGTEFDLDGLLRMDSASQIQSIKDAVGAGVMSPNEGRQKIDLKPVKGGESPYLQQQNYSLAALDERDRNSPLLDPGPNPGGTVEQMLRFLIAKNVEHEPPKLHVRNVKKTFRRAA